MNIYIALFRGINVGGKNALPMKNLAVILTDLGCEDVRTYIQSGNAVFRSKKVRADALAGDIGKRIKEKFDFDPNVKILTAAELRDAFRNNPFNVKEGKALHAFFLNSVPKSPDLEKLAALKTKTEDFKLRDKVFYLHTPDGVGRSRLAAAVEGCLGVPATARNWNTVAKLLEMAEE